MRVDRYYGFSLRYELFPFVGECFWVFESGGERTAGILDLGEWGVCFGSGVVLF